MYGIPQAGMLFNNHITKYLDTYGYSPTTHTLILWHQQIYPISFTLLVDDFGVKYFGWEHDKHLIAALTTLYLLTIDWEAKLYCGLTLNLYYNMCSMDLT